MVNKKNGSEMEYPCEGKGWSWRGVLLGRGEVSRRRDKKNLSKRKLYILPTTFQKNEGTFLKDLKKSFNDTTTNLPSISFPLNPVSTTKKRV